MSSVIFQPLLHDPLGWKTSTTTYADTFTWKKYRATLKDKQISTYGQKYHRQLEKQKQRHKLPQTDGCLPPATNDEQLAQRVNSAKQNDENRGPPPVSYRYSTLKPPSVAADETSVSTVENKQRPVSTNRESICNSRTLRRTPTAPATVEGTCRSATLPETRRSLKEEREKNIADSNNDNSRHWLVYPNPKTPQYLIDIKQRLGQLKIPSTLARPTSACTAYSEQQKQTFQSIQRSESSTSHHQQKQPIDQRHFLDFNLPETPNELRAARHRIEKHRYNSSLDDYPPRPQTCPGRTNDVPKPIISQSASKPENEQLPTNPVVPIKNDAWINDEENKTTKDETSSVMAQTIDIDHLPHEYVEAVETANTVQEEYLKDMNNDDKQSETCVYRLPSMSADFKNDSFIAYHNQQQSATPINNQLTRRNDFGIWVRNATDKERESAMKILNDVLNQPIMGYDIPTRHQMIFKQAPAPPSVRTNSATRKLGRTRTHQRISCEICEKQLIKRHVWDLSRSDALTCPHQSQTTKASIIQVQES